MASCLSAPRTRADVFPYSYPAPAHSHTVGSVEPGTILGGPDGHGLLSPLGTLGPREAEGLAKGTHRRQAGRTLIIANTTSLWCSCDSRYLARVGSETRYLRHLDRRSPPQEKINHGRCEEGEGSARGCLEPSDTSNSSEWTSAPQQVTRGQAAQGPSRDHPTPAVGPRLAPTCPPELFLAPGAHTHDGAGCEQETPELLWQL